jgi:CSLREA domain-containing protein
VSWYRAEGNANDFADGNNGTLQGGATFAAGEVGQAFSLNGTDAFVEIPDSPSLSVTGAITLEAWINPNSVTGLHEIISKYDSSISQESWALLVMDGVVRAEFLGSGDGVLARVVDTNTAVISTGVFTHLAATFDPATQAVHIYVNGVDVPTTVQNGGIVSSIFDSTSPMRIGSIVGGSGQTSEFFDGRIDEVDVYNRALSTAEVQGLFNAGSEGKATIVVNTTADTVDADPNTTSLREAILASNASVGDRDVIGFSVPRPDTTGLVSWYRAEGNADDAIDGNNGTLQNGATFAPGRYGQAFSFDGSDEFVQVSDAPNLDGMAQLTVEGWVKFNDLPAGKFQFMMAKGEVSGPGTNSYGIFRAGDSGRLLGFVETTGGLATVGGFDEFTDTSSFHHVALTYDGTTVKLFVDGVLTSSAALAGTVLDTPFPVLIGRRSGAGGDGNGDTLNGLVDELTIFNRALSDAEVQAIAKGPRTISPASALPTITDPVVIDGYTQPGASVNTDPTGFNGTLLIEISGASNTDRANGLRIAAGGSTVRGLVIGGFNGTPLTDDAQDSGILLESVGGNVIAGNFLGTDPTGTAAHPNGNVGIFVASPNNTIGGTSPADRNIISGNAPFDGVFVSPANGVGDASGNVIQGNFIGTQADGVSPLGNGRNGVTFTHGAHDNSLGGTTVGAGNVIAFNTVGVPVSGAAFGLPDCLRNSILGNRIFSNAGLGIDLGDDGVSNNDPLPGDADTGPNNLQNFPVLTSAVAGIGSTTITGTLNSTPNTTFRIEFFASDAPDASGFGEGQTFLGFTTVTTDGNGDVGFSVSLPVTVSTTQVVSATATDPAGNTSEFSHVVPVTLGGNTAPVITALDGPTLAVRGQPLDYTGSFSDPDPDTWTGKVNFGDGTGDQPLILNSDKTFAFHHEFAGTGTFTVTVTVADNHGGVGTRSLDVSVVVATLEPDPLDPSHPLLAVGGTTGNDAILVLPASARGTLQVIVNGALKGPFAAAGRIVVFGQDGNDIIVVSSLVSNPAWLFGGAGNDQLICGSGNSVMLGGSGDDLLFGGIGRDLLIGGTGADRIFGNGGDDLLLAGATAFDFNQVALNAIQAEWTSARDVATRVANISGAGTGPRNNGNFFLTTDGPSVTAFDDNSRDVLSGGPGADWFFANVDTGVRDIIIDLSARDFASKLKFFGP